jgi:hypothetical protein
MGLPPKKGETQFHDLFLTGQMINRFFGQSVRKDEWL